MVKRQPMAKRAKPVIDALREGKKTWTELRKLDVPEKTLNRILKEHLEFWGLAFKEGEYWTWYEYSRVFNSRQELDLFVYHSRKLLPALYNMLKAPAEDVFFDIRPPRPEQMAKDVGKQIMEEVIRETKNKEYIEQHLRTGYPRIFAQLQRLRELRDRLQEVQQNKVNELLQKLQGKVRTPDRFMLMDWKKKEPRSWLRKLLPEYDLVKRNIRLMYGPFDTQKEVKEILDEADAQNPVMTTDDGKYYILGPIFVRDPKMKIFDETMDKIAETWQGFAGEIIRLAMKVENNTPLEGKCEGCPEVRIK